MKKVLLALALMLSVTCLAGEKSSTVHNSNNIDATVELVNDSTLVYRNIDRLDVFQNSKTNNIGTVYIYKLDTSELVAVYKGDFSIELAKGDYLIISTKPFTSAKTETILDYPSIVY